MAAKQPRPKRKRVHDPENDIARWSQNHAAVDRWAAIQAEAEATGQWPQDWLEQFPSTGSACQAGPTGYCLDGHHHKCDGAGGPNSIAVETFLTDHRGRVWTALPEDTERFGNAYQVWRTGTPCRYRCPCTCHRTPRPVQLELF